MIQDIGFDISLKTSACNPVAKKNQRKVKRNEGQEKSPFNGQMHTGNPLTCLSVSSQKFRSRTMKNTFMYKLIPCRWLSNSIWGVFILSVEVERLWWGLTDSKVKQRSWFVLKKSRTKWISVISHLENSWIYPVLHLTVLSDFCSLLPS